MFDPTFHAIVDPWVGLTAVALRTSRIRLGTMITPLARRRPWKVARETIALDYVSDGRLILGGRMVAQQTAHAARRPLGRCHPHQSRWPTRNSLTRQQRLHQYPSPKRRPL